MLTKLDLVITEIGFAFINIYTVCDFTYDVYGAKCVTKEKIKKKLSVFTHDH